MGLSIGTKVLRIVLLLLGDGVVAVESFWLWFLRSLSHGRWDMCRRIGSGGDPFAPAGTDAEDSDDPDH